MVLRALPLVALGACLPPEPALVQPSLAIRAAQPDGRVELPGVTVEVDRAAFSLADLVLRGPDAEPVGDWAVREVVEVLGRQEPLGRARVYEGPVAGGAFTLVGSPGLDLRGVAFPDGGAPVPFDLAAAVPLAIPVSIELVVAEEDTAALLWIVDLQRVLGTIDFTTGSPLVATEEVLGSLRAGLTAEGAWSIVVDEAAEP